jgi:phage virion morphogenesis protein
VAVEFVRGGEKLSARIASIRKNVNVPDITQDISALLLKRTLTRFDKEQDPDGKAWKALSESTIETKRRKGYGGKGKLKRTESLRRSIRIIRGGAGTVYTNTGATVRIGVEDPKIAAYARAQNAGTRSIPARRFLGVGRLDVKAVDSLLRRRAARILED